MMTVTVFQHECTMVTFHRSAGTHPRAPATPCKFNQLHQLNNYVNFNTATEHQQLLLLQLLLVLLLLYYYISIDDK